MKTKDKVIIAVAVLSFVGVTGYIIYSLVRFKVKKLKDGKGTPVSVPAPLTAKAQSSENPFQLFPQGSAAPKEIVIGGAPTPSPSSNPIFQQMPRQGNVDLLKPKF
jgi:hypothetical protein